MKTPVLTAGGPHLLITVSIESPVDTIPFLQRIESVSFIAWEVDGNINKIKKKMLFMKYLNPPV